MSRPSVAVVIPWRPSPGRERNLAAALAGLKRAFGEYRGRVAQFDVILADSHAEPFGRAASRNVGVRAAGMEIVVALDADAVVEPDPIRAAVVAAEDGRLHLPFTQCRLLTAAGTAAVQAGADPAVADALRVVPNSVGGCVVVAYDTWLKVGGWDERFTHWGFEDTAFWCTVDTLFGTVRHDGSLYDLWHPDDRGIGTAEYRAGMALCDRYTEARGDGDAIRALIEERHAGHRG